ncbi:MAG: cupin domain-containing protein [Betaproteobacteria bacterium]|nr:cupin domain-containing protein [Betaproteobacteria bacterium]
MDTDQPLALLGGLSPRKFLREFWQRKPLVVRGAIRDFEEPLTAKEIFALAARDDSESRLVEGSGKRWSLTHGPIRGKRVTAAKRTGSPWTVLVQDVQHHSHEAHALLAHFGFVSNARIDDLMVSYAVDGGGVGPHVDSYDVFLLQGSGKRCWRISTQDDLSLVEGMPLKILKRFKGEQEFTLEKGDMLYLPPNVAHHGVAIGECLTWSVGFRAPTFQELGEFFLDARRDALNLEGQYKDPRLGPTMHPGAVDAHMQSALLDVMRRIGESALEEKNMLRALGCFLTAPKPHVLFDPADEDWPPEKFAVEVQRRGASLALTSRLLRCGGEFFLNGEFLPCSPADADALQDLADRRKLDPVQGVGSTRKFRAPYTRTLCKLLFNMHAAGAMVFAMPHSESNHG